MNCRILRVTQIWPDGPSTASERNVDRARSRDTRIANLQLTGISIRESTPSVEAYVTTHTRFEYLNVSKISRYYIKRTHSSVRHY